jgi:hypothetical protein
MDSAPIHQLVYSSLFNTGRIDSRTAALRDILTTSRSNNARAGISGCLLFDGSTFVQVLEGAAVDVMATYQRIEKDPRHREAATIGEVSSRSRLFGSWRMAGYLRTEAEDAIFREHGIVAKIERSELSVSQVLSLARRLADVQPAAEGA